MSDDEQYHLRWRGRQSGPYPISEINRMLDDYKIGMGHEIHYHDEWMTLESFFSALQKAGVPAPPPAKDGFPRVTLSPGVGFAPREKVSPVRLKVTAIPNAEAGRPRSRLVFALLAVFVGFTGAHNFYARQWMTGLLQLFLSVATSLMNFGIIASWLWAIIEAVVVRRDGHGQDMT